MTTRLSPLGVPGREYSFSPKTPTTEHPRGDDPFTRLSVMATPGGLRTFLPKDPATPIPPMDEPDRLGDPSSGGKRRKITEPFDISYWRARYKLRAGRQTPGQMGSEIDAINNDLVALRQYQLDVQREAEAAVRRRDMILKSMERKRLQRDVSRLEMLARQQSAIAAELEDNIRLAVTAIELAEQYKRKKMQQIAIVQTTIGIFF